MPMRVSSESEATTIDLWRKRFFVSVTLLTWLVIVGILARFIGLIAGPIILLTLAGLIAYIIHPLVKILERVLPRPLAIAVVFLALLLLLVSLLYFVILAAIQQLASLVTSLQTFVQHPTFQKQLQPIFHFLTQIGSSPQQLVSALQQVAGYLQGAVFNILPFISNLFAIIINVIILTSFCLYFLIDGSRAVHWFKQNTPQRFKAKINFFIDTLERSFGGYVRGQIILAVIITLITAVGASFIGVPFIILLAIIVFVFEFVPIIGAYISGTIGVLFALANGWHTALIMAIFVTIINGVLEGQILAPRILGHAIGLHPIISIFALLIGSSLFGIIGAVLAAPIAGLCQALIQACWSNWRTTHPEEFSPETPEET